MGQAVGGAIFYDVDDAQGAVVIELEHEHYRRLVIEVDDPAGLAASLNAAVAGRTT